MHSPNLNLYEKIQDLTLIQNAIRLSDHILSKHKEQLASQLWGRLPHKNSSTILRLLHDTKERVKKPWIRPITSNLNQAGGQLDREIIGHTRSIISIKLTSDDSKLVSRSLDGTLRIWKMQTGEEIGTLSGYKSSDTVIAISPDNKKVISECRGNLVVSNLNTGKEINRISFDNMSKIKTITITPDGDKIIVIFFNNNLVVWDLSTGKEKKNWHSTRKIFAAPYPSNSNFKILSYLNNNLIIYDFNTLQRIKNISFETSSTIKTIMMTQDGKRALILFFNNVLKVFDLDVGAEIKNISFETSSTIKTIMMTQDGKRALILFFNNVLKVFDLDVGAEIKNISLKEEGDVKIMAIANDGTKMVYSINNYQVNLFNLIAGKKIGFFPDNSELVNAIVISTDNTKAIFGTFGKNLKVWNIVELNQNTTYLKNNNNSKINKVIISSNKKQVISLSYQDYFDLSSSNSSNNKKEKNRNSSNGHDPLNSVLQVVLKHWDFETGRELKTIMLEGPSDDIISVILEQNNKNGIVYDSMLRSWDFQNGRKIRNSTISQYPAKLLTPDGKKAISVYQHYLIVNDVESGKKNWNLKLDNKIKIHSNISPEFLSYIKPEKLEPQLFQPTIRFNRINSVEVYRGETRIPKPVIPSRKINAVAVSHDSKKIIVIFENTIQTIKMENGDIDTQLEFKLEKDDQLDRVTIAQDNRRALYYSNFGNVIGILNLQYGVQTRYLQTSLFNEFKAIMITSDSKKAAVLYDNILLVCDAKTGLTHSKFHIDDNFISGLFFSNNEIVAWDISNNLHFLKIEE